MKLTFDSIHLRPFSDNDISFLQKVYFSTREKELEQTPDWTFEMKQAFLSHQFEAQHSHYQKNYPTAHFYIIEIENNTIGRLYIDEKFEQQNIRIIDITILPDWRNKGIGQQILTEIINRAKQENKKVSIHVETFNPAMQMYFRLGFKKVSETNGVYHLLEINMVSTK
jgi:N-acetylglutamate synthase-like GNAT family acetyltransferase